jgi:hypothetical protein
MLREGVLTGRLIDLRTGDTDRDDPASGYSWSTHRTVPAALLADLLTRANETQRPRALRLSGARITGALDLESAELVCPAILVNCWFEEPANLNGGNAPALHLRGCHLPALSAVQMSTRGDLRLDQGFTVRGEVRLAGARIGGQLSLDGATLTNPDGPALAADRLTVDQDMFCSFGFAVRGEVRLAGARIGGQLILDGATLTNPDGPALAADRLTVDQGMFCGQGFTAQGGVHLATAHIGGNLDLDAMPVS